jgi:voltage-gated potassium channel Kch
MKPMQRSVAQKVRYRFDNTISRGTLPVIGYLALLTFALVFTAALVLTITGTAVTGNKDAGIAETFWQSLLRILDPGTFSGDNGWFLRIVMLTVTLIGISIAAVLIGLIASGIEQRIEELRRGRSTVVESGHTLILGYSPRVFTIISELSIANENQSKPCIVVLADRDKREMEDELSSRVTKLRGTRVVCRTGDPANLNDLRQVSTQLARSIIVLGAGGASGDADVVKCVIAALHLVGNAKISIVAELDDAETARALEEASNGRVLTVRSMDVIARITAQACRQAGLSLVCQDLLDFDGDEIYFQDAAPLVGHTFGDALLAYETSSVIGIRRADGTLGLNPPTDTVFAEGDSVIAVSEDDDTVVFTGFRDEAGDLAVVGQTASGPEQLLVVGWNWLGPAILEELDQFVAPRSAVDVLVDPDLVDPEELADLQLQHLRVSYEAEQGDLDELTATVSGRSFDHVIILGYRDGLSASEADARTLLTLLLLRRALDDSAVDGSRSRIVTELLDAGDVELARATGADDFVVSDALSSYMLSQLSENPELNALFTDLFDAEGSAIGLKPAPWYVRESDVPYARVVAAARARGEAAIGYRIARGPDGEPEIVMNPPKSKIVWLGGADRVIVIGPPE